MRGNIGGSKKKIISDAKTRAFLRGFGKCIRTLRIERKVTRACLGKQIGLSVFRIDQLETGKLDLDVVRASEIISALCLTSNILFPEAESSPLRSNET